jgi:hypothetical protein
MEIKIITAATNPQTGQLNLFGLGADNKTYLWSYKLGGWFPNWQQEAQTPANVAQEKVETLRRKARRAVKAKSRKRKQ